MGEKKEKKSVCGWESSDSEMQREMYRRSRDAILILSANFIDKATPRLKELAKLLSISEHCKIPEVFDHKCHVVSFNLYFFSRKKFLHYKNSSQILFLD